MFAEAIKVTNSLCTLDLSGNALFDDAFKFNMTILDAMHFNRSIINLGLSYTFKFAAEIKNKIEAVNKERDRQGEKVLCTSIDEDCALDYCHKLETKCVKLSYL